MRADSAIAVSGMLNATVVSNPLATYIVDTIPCPSHLFGASVSWGYASGSFSGYSDVLYSGCLTSGHP